MSYREDILSYEQRLMRWIAGHDPAVKAIFNEFVNSISPYLSRYKQVKPDQIWYRNRSVELAIERELQTLQKNLQQYILKKGAAAWNLASTKTNRLVSEYIKGMSISNVIREGMFIRGMDALKTFQTRRVGGMTLSERVWKVAEQAKENIEYYLQSGLSTGKSAAGISQDVRSLLNNPDAHFRRVRDPETGKLKLSRPMAAYHPGQGVYRSAFRNALRMTRTETNMAYRMSDQARWKNLDFVLGYEVKLSNSHPEWDICDSMVGQYSKDFVFEGWHPNCYCYTVPILLGKEQFVNYLKTDRMSAGAYISEIPAEVKKYVASKTPQLKQHKTMPYWIEANFKMKNGKYVPNLTKVTKKVKVGV